VQERGKNLNNVYPSIIEPYVGEPFITSTRAVPIPGNERDSLRAVAVEVKTRSGRTDLCFSDGRIKQRRVGQVSVTGRFAHVSTDERGLRLAHLVEGTQLTTPWGTLRAPTPALKGKVAAVNYWQRAVTIDAPWPVDKLIGEQVEIGNSRHRTSYTVTAARRQGAQVVLTFDKAADLSYAGVAAVNASRKLVTVNVAPVAVTLPGKNAGLTCTNADMTKSWRCSYAGRDKRRRSMYKLEGTFAKEDLPEGSVFRVWEYGVGDEVRLATRAIVRRQDDGAHRVESNAAATWEPRR